MRNWTGTRIREDALRVPCSYCHALIDEPCVNGDQPLEAFPAHVCRISAAKAAQVADGAQEPVKTPQRGSESQEWPSEPDAETPVTP
jgi:hypothetical protein